MGEISGVILAGGAGRRFEGLVKPKIIVEGVTILSRILSVTEEIFDERILVTNSPGEFGSLDSCIIISDEIQGAGPLGGIHAAMRKLPGNALFVFAGDMPFLDRGIITEMIAYWKESGCEALVPRVNTLTEPLHAIYDASLAFALETFLRNYKGRSVRDFLKTVKVRYFDLEESDRSRRAFTNINSPSDLDRAD